MKNQSAKFSDEYKRIVIGNDVENLGVDGKTTSLSKANNFEVKAYKIKTFTDEEKSQRIVRIGAIQNKIVLPTTESTSKQKFAISQLWGNRDFLQKKFQTSATGSNIAEGFVTSSEGQKTKFGKCYAQSTIVI